MAKVSLTILLSVLLTVLAGCYKPDSGRSQLVPRGIEKASFPVVEFNPSDTGEADVVENVAIGRQAYERGLEHLVTYYKATGNNMKLRWVQDELSRFIKVPKYNYIVEANVAGPDLKAAASITEADYMYQDARLTDKKARRWVVYVDEDLLRTALAKYNRVIRRHPSSNKIDDAAFYSAGICEYFKDYSIALLYYHRAYQWDPDTTHPARLMSARILDKKLHRRSEALELYQEFVGRGKGTSQQLELAKRRIKQLITGVYDEED